MMVDTSTSVSPRRLSFGSRTFPIDKYLSGIDNSEVSELTFVDKQHVLQFISPEDLERQKELFSKLKYNSIQNNTVHKMHEYLQEESSFDVAESERKLKYQKQAQKKVKSEQQKVTDDIRQAIEQIVQLQEKYQAMQANLRSSLAPLNQSCELADDTKKEKVSVEIQTQDYEEEEEREVPQDQAILASTARMTFQRQMTSQLCGIDLASLSPSEATLRIGQQDTLAFALENGVPDLLGSFCDATFAHGDILDYAARNQDPALLFYELQSRLRVRDALAADVAAVGNSVWDGAWRVRVTLPHGQSACLVVDTNYGSEYGRVKVESWTALEEAQRSNSQHLALLRKTMETIGAGPLNTIPQVARVLSNTTASVY